jgi:hypothetical protein
MDFVVEHYVCFYMPVVHVPLQCASRHAHCGPLPHRRAQAAGRQPAAGEPTGGCIVNEKEQGGREWERAVMMG